MFVHRSQYTKFTLDGNSDSKKGLLGGIDVLFSHLDTDIIQLANILQLYIYDQ